MTLDRRKLELVNAIVSIEDNEVLTYLEKAFLKSKKLKKDIPESLAKLTGEIEKSIDLEKLKKEQGVKPLDMKAFKKKTSKLVFEESIEENLAFLKK
ncbi:MAG: hypothetical protein AAF741_07625 [Bacteroidota bacterium]